MSGKNNPRYFETVGTNVLKLIEIDDHTDGIFSRKRN